MNKKLLNNLVCPQCHHEVEFNQISNSIDCDVCELSYPVKDGIPVMLLMKATQATRAEQ